MSESVVKNKKKVKRYENETQILEDINRVNALIVHHREEAVIMDKFADVLRDHGAFLTDGLAAGKVKGSKYVLSLPDYRHRADINRNRAANYESKQLPKLKNALAEMRTGVFPEIVGDDESVIIK